MRYIPRDLMTRRARTLRAGMTPWERKLWYIFLKDHPIHIYRQRVIGNYIVDFYCDAAKVAIELDGSGHYSPDQSAYDAERDAFLKSQGIEVVRIANIDDDHNFRGICEAIDHAIRAGTGRAGDR